MTEKETKRIEKTTSMINKWERDGYTKVEKTISIEIANTVSILVCAPFVIAEYFLYTSTGHHFGGEQSTIKMLIYITLMFASFGVHECIHWVFMGLFAGSWKNVELGFLVEKLTPYCTCQEPLKRWQYIISLLAPFTILSSCGMVYAMICNDYLGALFAMISTLGGGGDLMITFILLFYKKKTKNMFILDHPIKCGFYAMEKD